MWRGCGPAHPAQSTLLDHTWPVQRQEDKEALCNPAPTLVATEALSTGLRDGQPPFPVSLGPLPWVWARRASICPAPLPSSPTTHHSRRPMHSATWSAEARAPWEQMPTFLHGTCVTLGHLLTSLLTLRILTQRARLMGNLE